MTLKIRQQRRQAGFTLVELLMVMVILSFLVGMVMPFANHQDKQTKIKQTNAIFAEIRMAILGARNAFDAEGNRVIGGYVGDVGQLPKLYVYAWDNTNDQWTHPDTPPPHSTPPTTANSTPATPVAGDQNAEPAALWKTTLPGGYPADVLEESGWNGPYMASPKDPFPDDSLDFWESSADADQQRQFRLHEAQGRLTDGWGKALIIYVDGGDSNIVNGIPQNLVFVSAGPDRRYDAGDPTDSTKTHNEDNLVLIISQSEWDDSDIKALATQNQLLEIKRALIGKAPTGLNDGYTGDVCKRPELFQWDDDDAPNAWDNLDGTTPYTKGQPRGLWTQKPNSDGSDNIAPSGWSQPGVGWRHAYLQSPWETDADQVLRDAWGRKILFFKNKPPNDDYLVILSRGADGKYSFGDETDLTEDLDYFGTDYDPTNTDNKDNIVLPIPKSDWDTTTNFILQKFTVHNADGNTKARLYRGASGSQLLKNLGPANPGVASSSGGVFGGGSAQQGTRVAVFWQDNGAASPNDDQIDADELRYTYRFDIDGGNLTVPEIIVDTNWFELQADAPLP